MFLFPSLPRSREGQRPATWPFVAVLFLLSSSGHAADFPPLTLDEAMQRAAAHAPGLDAQAARLLAAQEDAARAGRLPDPVLSAGIDNLTVTGADAFRLGADEMTMQRIGVMQAWPSKWLRAAEREVARAQANAISDESVWVKRQVERAAGDAWIASWAAEKERAFLQAQREDAERAARIAEAQLANGSGSAASALAADVAGADLESQLLAAETAVNAARAGLTRWLGDRAQAGLAAAPDFGSLTLPPARLLSSVGSHAELAGWNARERAAEAAIEVARARKRPRVAFGASYGTRVAGLPDMATFEVTIDLPVFARNRQDRDIAARRAEADAVHAEREEATREHRETVERLLATWTGLRSEHARLIERVLPLAQDRREVALAAYANGEPIQAWLDARRDEVALRRRAVQTEAALARAWLQLNTLSATDANTRIVP
ncbi:MAG: TolC family protein [Chiayiivirga sp.]|jgi:cobalt-zinc-cadmium efflux system outer membrane protein|uniref:TolC family protein n=1 Tax=Chiayiivirga sp. TaxID=2041042 RepID=UPI0025C19ECF|nr:TolC family protein [Chiayiivirga sp.]MCI1730009.1 TolC family protein [Chiayiivirga sp.]